MPSFWQDRRDSLSSSSSSSASSTPSSSPPSLTSSFRDTPTIQTSFVSVSVFSPASGYSSSPCAEPVHERSSAVNCSAQGSFRHSSIPSAYISDEDLAFDDDDDCIDDEDQYSQDMSSFGAVSIASAVDDADDCLAPSYHGARRRYNPNALCSATDFAIATALFPTPPSASSSRRRAQPSRRTSRSVEADKQCSAATTAAAPLPPSHQPTQRKRRRNSSADRRGRRMSTPMEVIQESPEHE